MTHCKDFDSWWERFGQPYEAAVIAKGGTPWVNDPVKRPKIAATLGLPEDTPDMELRRALWLGRGRTGKRN
ncbi:hypothetical protein QN239_25685 [Mycolicibacterium sp. Y3]